MLCGEPALDVWQRGERSKQMMQKQTMAGSMVDVKSGDNNVKNVTRTRNSKSLD